MTYSNLLANFLYNANLIDHERKVRFYVATMELLINAIEHGNCQITYEEKSAYLEERRRHPGAGSAEEHRPRDLQRRRCT